MKKYICEYCNNEFKSGQSLGGHKISCKHDPNFEEKRLKRAKKISEFNTGKKLSDETKEKISKSRTKYLLENPDKVPYLLNHSSKISYPEKTIIKYLKQYNIDGWVHQMQFSIYQLDFAFPEYKLCVEIDGATHLLDSVKNKDKKRDKFLNKNGWRVLRITAKQVKNNVYDCINLILNNLGKKQIEIPKEFINNKYYKYKKKQEQEYERLIKKQKKLKEKQLKYEKRKQIILDSNINFRKYGGMKKLAKLLNMSDNGVKKFIKLYMPDFYNNNNNNKVTRVGGSNPPGVTKF